MATLPQLVEQARGYLHQYTTTRPVLATFTGWQGTAPNYTGINLAGLSGQQRIVNAVVELGHELVFVSSHDPTTSTTQCPPWFRNQQGSPSNDAYAVNSVAVVNPQWPYHQVAQHVINGISNLYPSLFQVKQTTLTTATLTERFLLPADVDEIIKVRVEDDLFPSRPERELWKWTLDTKGPNGSRYLYVNEFYRSGMTIYVTYRAAPIIPAVTSTAEFTATGLPSTASDLPVLWAVAQMLPAADAAKAQISTVEQSERNRFVQAGSANAASRRYHELYQTRLVEERRKLLDLYPPRIHRTFN